MNTVSNYFTYKKVNADIVYINAKKKIFFSPNKVKTKFLDKRIEKKYFFLINNEIINDARFDSGYFVSPLYTGDIQLHNSDNPSYEIELIKDILLKLMKKKIIMSSRYVSKMKYKISRLNIDDKDSLVVRECEFLDEDIPVCRTLVHGDLWRGNIINLNNSVSLIDWDDLTCKSFSYDLFHYQFQYYGANLESFNQNYNKIKETVLPIMVYFSKKCDIPFFEKEYHLYYNLFLMERMIKRYDQRIYKKNGD